MPRVRVIRQIAATTLREFLRSPEAVFWTYGFPVMMSVVLGLAFSRDEPEPSRVSVVASASAQELVAALAEEPDLEVRVVEEARAIDDLRAGRTELVVRGTPAAPVMVRSRLRPESELARLRVADALERRAGRRNLTRQTTLDPPSAAERYIDFLIPGLIGLNLLGAGLFGVGFNLVDMRAKYLLRRLVVSPMSRAEFLLGFMFSRLLLVVVDALLILAFGMLAFGVPMKGSWLALLALLVLGGLTFSGIGLVVASRPKTVEGVSGLMNLVMIPMWLLCGSFFRTTYFPAELQPVVMALPLTHANDALRAVCAGGGLVDVWVEVAVLAGFAVGTFAIALRVFRWK